jgi:protein-L-isoaspartate(D-aspartate) O-methyltransferase
MYSKLHYGLKRKQLVADYVRRSGVTDIRVLDAISTVPRHEFVPARYRKDAYRDIPLDIGAGQTISQPSLVALMTQLLALKGDERVLEIGTGSGYQAAILSVLAKQVYTIERIPTLAVSARKTLKELKYLNVHVYAADGTLGFPKHAPYDAIIVTAGAKQNVPKLLIDQLADEGRIVYPAGASIENQILKIGVKKKNTLHVRDIEQVRFVPLIGKYGWKVH